MRYPVNRRCPVSGAVAKDVIGYLPAALVAAQNPTYRESFAQILGIRPEDEFPLVRGPTGLVFSGWLPPHEFLTKVYEDVIDHSRSVTQSLGYRRMLLEFAASFLQFVEESGKNAGPLKLLDYGCGYGALLQIFASRAIQATGFEPSAGRGQRAAQTGMEITSDVRRVEECGPFDLIVLTEVLEHVPDPRLVLRALKDLAAPGALLAITVPCCEEVFINQSIRDIQKLRLPIVFNPWEHLNYFSSENLRTLLEEEGFKVVNDYGRTRAARDGCARFGEQTGSVAIKATRVAKRAFCSPPSTELFCRSA